MQRPIKASVTGLMILTALSLAARRRRTGPRRLRRELNRPRREPRARRAGQNLKPPASRRQRNARRRLPKRQSERSPGTRASRSGPQGASAPALRRVRLRAAKRLAEADDDDFGDGRGPIFSFPAA